MKTKLTFSALFVMLFLMAGITQSFAMQARDNGDDEGHPNFTYIDDFNEHVAMWWNPEGAGQTTGIILEDDEGNLITYREHETEIVNEATGSIGSMKLAVVWDTDVEWFEPTPAGSQSHYIRLYMPPSNANVPERRFEPGQALEIFIYGDGSNNRFRFMVRDGVAQLEGSPWLVIDWTGWKRVIWDYNDAANVFGWVNGDGQMDEGNPFYFDSIHITRNEAGTTTEGLFYFDDLRIVDPFIASFNITNGDGSEVISINNVTYAAGQTEFELFPGEYEFFVQREGYESYYGSFEIDDEDVTIDVTLTPGEDQEYDVTFTIMDTEGDLIPNAVIKINDVTYDPGEYIFSFVPGFYNYLVTTDAHFDVDGSFVVVNTNVFINVVMEVIPDLNDQILLSWDVASTANMEQYREEYYSVWAGLAGGEPADFWMIYEETLDPEIPNFEYQHRSLDISNLNQENIQIAFRHHNVTDMEGIVIDNVKIEGINIGGSPDVLLFEDFEGGVPDGFDPANPVDYDEAWLPAGWAAIDANDDGFNWHFAIEVLDDDNYIAHMRSLSYDSDGGALEPDNWLFTPAVQLPLVLFYTATFNIADEAGNPVENAIITLNGTSYNPGQYQFTLINGQYNFEISKEGYISVEGTFTISGQSISIDVTLPTTPLYSVTFNVNMNQADGFVPGETEVFMTGDFPAWDMAPPGTYDEQKLEPTENIFIFTRTLELPAGVYQYIYFDGPSFDNAEWHDDVFRTINVTDDMTVDDVFGVYEPVSVPEYDMNEITIFPNPASSYFNVSSETIIDELSIYDLSGKLIFNKKIGNSSTSIDLSSFNTGLYIIRIHSDNDHQIKKLQIVR